MVRNPKAPTATFSSTLRYNEIAVKIEVDIPIPEGAVDESTLGRLRHDAFEAAVLRLFEERRISAAEATHELGLTRIQFMELTRKREIAHYDYTSNDLAEDLLDLEKIQEQVPPFGFPR